MYAIVKTGGKQYRVAADDVIEVEKLAVEPDGVVELDVVFVADGSKITTDTDALLKAKVFATVLEQFKGEKQIIFKFKKRKGYKRLKGHRQNLTRLRIDHISLDGKAPAPKKTAEKAKPDAKPEKDEKKAASKESAKAVDKEASAVAEKPVDTKAEKPVDTKAEKPVDAPAPTDEVPEPEKKPKRRASSKKADADEDGDEKAKPKARKTTSEGKPSKKTTTKKSEEDETEE